MQRMSDYNNRGGQPGTGTGPAAPEEKEEMAAEHEVSPVATAQYLVGDELRMRRESMGQSIADVVDSVRIQTRYLEALEDNRIDDLPDAVYSLGFVRTYSDYLGLDAAEMVARFKEETQGIKSSPILAMPEPIEEAKVPTAAILFVAILLAAIGYGVWYFLSQSDDSAALVVPDVPERLASVAEPPAMPPPAAIVTLPAAETAEPAGSGPVATTEGDMPPPAADNGGSPVEPAAAPVAEAAPAAPAPETVAVAQPPPAPGPAEPETVVLDVPTAPPVEEVPREPRVYGLGNADARIVIIAIEDAWVEVTDTDDARLFSRVLRKGDSYRAPNRDGAKFVTGNAGGLKITVDGQPAPPLGPSGLVRRNVKLDPDLLKAGRASQ